MTQVHPITPPPAGLVQHWREEAAHRLYTSVEADEHIAERAARWGCRAKIEADRNWFHDNPFEGMSNMTMQNCRIVLKELQGVCELANRTGHDPSEASGPYLEMLLKICRDHVAVEQLRKASAECQPTP